MRIDIHIPGFRMPLLFQGKLKLNNLKVLKQSAFENANMSADPPSAVQSTTAWNHTGKCTTNFSYNLHIFHKISSKNLSLKSHIQATV